MAYDTTLADRIRTALAAQPITEKQMFGGIGFMLGGNMVCGIYKHNLLMLHVPAEKTAALLERPGALPFEMRGKPMRGWVLVEPGAVKTAVSLANWIEVALVYAQSLPAKTAAAKKKMGASKAKSPRSMAR